MNKFTFGNWVVDLHGVEYTPTKYFIAALSLKDESIVHWIEHLRKKTWFTNAELYNFELAYKKLLG